MSMCIMYVGIEKTVCIMYAGIEETVCIMYAGTEKAMCVLCMWKQRVRSVYGGSDDTRLTEYIKNYQL